MSSTKKPQPKFDFSRVGKKWQEEFSQSAETATRASFTIQRPLRKQRRDEEDDDYSEYVQKFYDDKEAALCDSEIAELRKIERFANLVAAHKAEVITAEAYRCGYKDGMEAGAVICEQWDASHPVVLAAAIRARGTT